MANLIFTLPDGVVINAKVSKVNAEAMQKPAIIQKTEKGEMVRTIRRAEGGSDFGTFKWITQVQREVEKELEGTKVKVLEWCDAVTGDKFKDYAINPDTNTLELVKQFEPTKQVNLSWSLTLPVTYAGRLLQDSLYEVYGAKDVDNLALCKLIDEAIEKDVMFVHENFVWRTGYSAYHAIFVPNRDADGKYSLTMMTTTGKALYQHKMTPIPEEEEGKEVKVLPSLLNTLIGA